MEEYAIQNRQITQPIKKYEKNKRDFEEYCTGCADTAHEWIMIDPEEWNPVVFVPFVIHAVDQVVAGNPIQPPRVQLPESWEEIKYPKHDEN